MGNYLSPYGRFLRLLLVSPQANERLLGGSNCSSVRDRMGPSKSFTTREVRVVLYLALGGCDRSDSGPSTLVPRTLLGQECHHQICRQHLGAALASPQSSCRSEY